MVLDLATTKRAHILRAGQSQRGVLQATNQESVEAPWGSWVVELILDLWCNVQTSCLIKLRVVESKGVQSKCEMLVHAFTTEQVATLQTEMRAFEYAQSRDRSKGCTSAADSRVQDRAHT